MRRAFSLEALESSVLLFLLIALDHFVDLREQRTERGGRCGELGDIAVVDAMGTRHKCAVSARENVMDARVYNSRRCAPCCNN